MMKYLTTIFAVLLCINMAGQEKKPDTVVKDTLSVEDIEAISPQKLHNIIKTNPLAMLYGHIPFSSEYRVLFEFTTAPHQATQLGISYMGPGPIKAFLDSIGFNFSANGYRVQAAHRFYSRSLSQLIASAGFDNYEYAPFGFYFAPMVSYATMLISNKAVLQYDMYYRVVQFNAQLTAGYQWEVWDALSIDTYIGMGYKDNYLIDHTVQGRSQLVDLSQFPLYNNHFKMSISFAFGYTF